MFKLEYSPILSSMWNLWGWGAQCWRRYWMLAGFQLFHVTTLPTVNYVTFFATNFVTY